MPQLTAGQLKQWLADVPDNMQAWADSDELRFNWPFCMGGGPEGEVALVSIELDSLPRKHTFRWQRGSIVEGETQCLS